MTQYMPFVFVIFFTKLMLPALRANKSKVLCFCCVAYQPKASSHLYLVRKNIQEPRVLEHKYIFYLIKDISRSIKVKRKFSASSLRTLMIFLIGCYPLRASGCCKWLLASSLCDSFGCLR